MKELSLNILDIAENSLKAGATLVGIDVTEEKDTLTVTVSDNGCGMTEEFLKTVTDPFSTTRTTRKVGLGIPLLKMEAEQTGGSFSIQSQVGKGTLVKAVYVMDSIDRPPRGDIAGVVYTAIICNPELDFIYRVGKDGREFIADTRELKAVLNGVPLDDIEVGPWLAEYLKQGENDVIGGVL